MNLSADSHMKLQYSMVDTIDDDNSIDEDIWDYRKLFLDFSNSYLGDL